jgi:tetratricopeptide (TPR) repeat protein
MAEHVERSDPDRIGQGTDLAVEALATVSKDRSLQICFRCHALKDVMQQGYVPGKPFEDHYSLGFPMLGASPLFPDGRIRTFAYQGNHLYSDCYLNGSMTCVDCHDPHTQKYRDIWGRELDGRFSDEQCTDCHASKADRPEEHSHHEPGTDGGKCVDCHMPYLQHPELGSALRFARSDHTIPVPRPGADDRMGIVNACALSGCHPDSSISALEAVTREWYGELKPRKPIVEALLAFDRLEDERAATEVLLDSTASHPAAQVAAVGAFAMRFLSPDVYRLDGNTEQALKALSRSDDLDLRAVSLAALQLARGGDRAMRDFLIESLERSEDDGPALRDRWAKAVGTFADQYFGAGDWNRAIVTYRKALEIRADDPAILMNQGLAQFYAQDFRRAVTSLQRSIAVDPRRPLAWVNLGLALEGTNDVSGAEAAYRRAIRLKDEEPLAHFNLGNILLRRGDRSGAIEQYERAVELEPTMTQAYLYMLGVYVESEDLANAVRVARRWARFDPDDPRPRQLLVQVEGARRFR